MESGFYFTALVLAVGVLHLIWQTAAFIGRISESYSALDAVEKPKIKRDDWYMFFHRSDLTGKSREKKEVGGPPSQEADLHRKKTLQKRSALRMHL